MEIPEGWTLSDLQSIAPVIDCKHRTPSYVETGVPIISPGDIGWNGLDFQRARRVSKSDAVSLMDHCTVEEGDLIVGRNQKVGIAALVDEKTDIVIGQDTVLVKSANASPKYLQNLFASDIIKRQIYRLLGGSTFGRVNLKDFRKLQLPLPPLRHRIHIAEILGTWDRAIAATEALIAKSEAQKKALMQQLLTAKRRLAGFEGEWKEGRLDEIFQFKKGKGISKKAVVEDGLIPCVLYGELYTHYGDVVRTVKSKTNSNEGVPSVVGDVLIPASTTTTGIDLANATAVLEGGIRLGGDINILRPLDANTESRFIARLLTYAETFKLAKRAQGSTIVHLYGNHLKDIVVSVPGHAEQVAISDAIDLSEQPIQALQAKLQTLKTEKAALMQQLLTGKRRVKLTEAAA